MANEDKSATNHSHSGHLASCQCNCKELAANLEGLKLEMVISESKLKAEISCNMQALDKLREQWHQIVNKVEYA